MMDDRDGVASAKHRLFWCHYAFLFETIHNPTTLAARLFLAGLARLESLNFKKFVEELEMKEICGKLWSTCGELLHEYSVHVLQHGILM